MPHFGPVEDIVEAPFHGKFHNFPVPGNLQAGGGDLLKERSGRIDPLAQLDTVNQVEKTTRKGALPLSGIEVHHFGERR